MIVLIATGFFIALPFYKAQKKVLGLPDAVSSTEGNMFLLFTANFSMLFVIAGLFGIIGGVVLLLVKDVSTVEGVLICVGFLLLLVFGIWNSMYAKKYKK